MCPDDRDERSWRDDDRPSWKEIDKRRDRSSHSRDEKPAFSGSKKQQAYMKQMALRQADKLFTPKKSDKQRKDEQELEQAKGSDAFAETAQKFMDTYGVTDDWHVQLVLAEVPLSKIAVPAIESLVESAAALEKSEKQSILSQLRILALTGKSKIKMAAKAALDQIK